MAVQTKARVANRKADPEACFVKPLRPDEQPEEADQKILDTIMKRDKIYYTIIQFFNIYSDNFEEEASARLRERLAKILKEAGNSARVAILLMK